MKLRISRPSTFTLPAEGYQILIIHTHGTEAYTPEGTDVYEPSDDYRTTDTNYSVIRVGRALAEALRAYGLNVLHDEGLYDYPSYTSSYVRSGQAIEEYLEAKPDANLKIVYIQPGDPVCIPLRKNAESASLLAAINQIIADAKADGTLAELSNRFFGKDLTVAP